jgi:hypothetical protein
MSEQLRYDLSPEQRVFGYAFSLQNGAADEKTQEVMFKEKYIASHQGKHVWLPNTLDADTGVTANLYWQGKIVAFIDHNFATRLTDVYVADSIGTYPDHLVYDQISFDAAVVIAEIHSIRLGAPELF